MTDGRSDPPVPAWAGRIELTGAPDADQRAELTTLLTDVERADGVAAFSEQGLFLLFGSPSDAAPGSARTVLAIDRSDGDRIVGVAGLDAADPSAPSAELAVHPDHRRRGYGSALLARLRESAPAGLRIWAHGDRPGAVGFAAAHGLRKERVLWQLRRSLTDPLPEVRLPDGVHLRGFRVGADESAWLRVNARAFADHPEQGRMTLADLRAREAEAWFDPDGFLLAESGGEVIGFHWTKVHPAGAVEPEPIGEVYVVGTDPSRQGRGLGAALTVAGLRYLAERGLGRALLYVDDDNAAAVALYRRLGFTEWSSDVQYAVPDAAPARDR